MSAACLTGYAHATAVAALVRGYHLGPMADDERDESPRGLRRRQEERADEEARSARRAEEPDEARLHERRAEKAAYLGDKLAEAERADRD
jgi:hypothetical protein